MRNELKEELEDYVTRLPPIRRVFIGAILSIIMPGAAPKIMGSALVAVLIAVVILGVTVWIGIEVACTFFVKC